MFRRNDDAPTTIPTALTIWGMGLTVAMNQAVRARDPSAIDAIASTFVASNGAERLAVIALPSARGSGSALSRVLPTTAMITRTTAATTTAALRPTTMAPQNTAASSKIISALLIHGAGTILQPRLLGTGSVIGHVIVLFLPGESTLMYGSWSQMYNWLMSVVSVADARNHLSDVIDRSRNEAVFIERRGRRAAVVVSPEQYERMLEALEDAEDVASFDEAMAEEGANIPWAQVKADLGWK